ncbi:MAG: error-prone DNA polymerase [Bdellovibrionales bacterium]|nr:error-prone DNA polymerase [Bdellovibrionales bacterium]
MKEYAELQAISNFSFLRGASHPEELVQKAHHLGYRALAMTDENSLSGIVRAHVQARELDFHFVVACGLTLLCEDYYSSKEPPEADICRCLVYPTTKEAYGTLCQLLSLGKQRGEKGECLLTLQDFLGFQDDYALVLIPPCFYSLDAYSSSYEEVGKLSLNHREANFTEYCKCIRDSSRIPDLISLSFTKNFSHENSRHLESVHQLGRHLSIPLLATNDVHYHDSERRALQDVITCIRKKTTIEQAGYSLLSNAERHLKSVGEMWRLFHETPGALKRTVEIAEACSTFSLADLTYEYPREVCPSQRSPQEHLREITWKGAKERYPEGVPKPVEALISQELELIHELHYEKYFLTCFDIVAFARTKNILCQGRGAAANSAVCFCLGITAVDPGKIDTLFARFVSKERNEPPDIDIDFEHERREEVIQYIYDKYGRDRAALTCEVVTYRHRSALREVGKALGLSLSVVDVLAKSLHRWTKCVLPREAIQDAGLNPDCHIIQNTLLLAGQLLGFPRHLSQHVGGFIISEAPLSKIVPIRNASMDNRTIIEWDKNDIEELGMLKIDILALGMLTCIRKAFALINRQRMQANQSHLSLASLPSEDAKVYDMISEADTIGVFQVESRAQMSMLPRLKPRCFYDLVIEVAIVRPGPIQGKMVHPYLQCRLGKKIPYYPDPSVKDVLGKTFGVPIFQEQAMRLCIVLAGFTPGEAEQLRRAMAAWKKKESVVSQFQKRIFEGMLTKGYEPEFIASCIEQLKGFSEYGFPESHAASFAMLVYGSAWLKLHYPAEFAIALINSQPMGFYASAQILDDAKRHGITVFSIDINKSSWDCTLNISSQGDSYLYKQKAIQLGFRLIHGIQEREAQLLIRARESYGKFSSLEDLWQKLHIGTHRVQRRLLFLLAKADAFQSIGLSRRQALWAIRALPVSPTPLDPLLRQPLSRVRLPKMTKQQEMFADYESTSLSLRSHPLETIRKLLSSNGVLTAQDLVTLPRSAERTMVCGAGMMLFRQRPGTAKGVVFVTLEDETGMVNLIIPPETFEQYQRTVLMASCLKVSGNLQRIGKVVYILTHTLESLDQLFLEDTSLRYESRSYSY